MMVFQMLLGMISLPGREATSTYSTCLEVLPHLHMSYGMFSNVGGEPSSADCALDQIDYISNTCKGKCRKRSLLYYSEVSWVEIA